MHNTITWSAVHQKYQRYPILLWQPEQKCEIIIKNTMLFICFHSYAAHHFRQFYLTYVR